MPSTRISPAHRRPLRIGRGGQAAALLTALTLLASLLGVTAPSSAGAEEAAEPTTLSLSSSGSFPVGGSLALHAEINAEIQSTLPGVERYVSIWDLTTGTRIAMCTSGTTCDGSSHFYTGGPRQYQAFYTLTEPTSLPAVGVLTSAVVTGERQAWTIDLASVPAQFPAGGSSTLTAMTNQDVGLTGGSYRIRIRELSTSVTVAECASGTSCQATVGFHTGGPRTYQAVVSSSSDPGLDAQAKSADVTVGRQPWTVGLQAPTGEFVQGEEITLTATANQDVGLTGGSYRIWIQDVTTGLWLHSCTAGTTCAVAVTFSENGSHTYRALVSSSADPTIDVQAESNSVVLTHKPWSVVLTQDKAQFAAGEQITLTATPNQLAYGYRTWIWDLTTDTLLKHCHTNVPCSVATSFYTGHPHQYKAYITDGWYTRDVSGGS